MGKYILGIDAGTSGIVKCCIMDMEEKRTGNEQP